MPFVFWGLFVACGLVVVAYAGWMWWVERRRPDAAREDAAA